MLARVRGLTLAVVSRRLAQLSVPLAVLAFGLVLLRPGTLTPASASPDRNVERARITAAVVDRYFHADGDHFLEVEAQDGYATLWPLSQAMVGMLSASRLPGDGLAVPSTTAFDGYWDDSVAPPGYSASMHGDRRFFDDNAWTGLALMQAYHLSGDPLTLGRVRQIFAFIVSGWDSDPTHPDPGGVWWSQQMPNPRFIHRNTVSTATSAELGLQLYEASGRTESYYLEWATRMYAWVDAYLRGANGLYGDHVDLAGVVDPGQLTYNQGTMVGAGVLLYRIDRDPAYLSRARDIADTSLEVFGPAFSQPPAYNAVFFRNLLLLGAETGDDRYRAAMQAYADQVWDTQRDPTTNLFNFAYGRNRTFEPHRLLDQGAMLQIYATLALGATAPDILT